MWNRKMYGSSRSLVRLVGSNLPISTGERLHIQLPHVPNSAVSSPVGPSRGTTDFPIDGITLAGLLQDSDDLLRGQLRPTHLAPILEDAARGDGEDESGIVMTGGGEDDDESVEGRHTESEDATRRRISALEAELAGLRAHIAAYALADLQENVQAAPPPPPPPPPPPVLDPEMSVSTTTSDVPSVPDGPVPPPATPSNARPDMSSMLHQLSAIKLRAVEKSPGGTPQRHTQSRQQPPAVDDPAAIIAHALRKKFSHRVFQDSPDRDNLNRSFDSSPPSEFSSPATKLFEQSPQSSEDK